MNETLLWPCWIEVDLDAIRHNVRAIGELLPPDCRFMAVVKAQAYGHGAVAVARAALEAGATWLAVARVREAVQLREAGIDAPILLLGPFTATEAPLVVRCDLRPTLVDPEQARLLSEAAVSAAHADAPRPTAISQPGVCDSEPRTPDTLRPTPGTQAPTPNTQDLAPNAQGPTPGPRPPTADPQIVRIHAKVDTGLSRYGAPARQARELLRRVAGLPGLELEGLYSHFATADDPDLAYAERQLEAFRGARAALEGEGFRFSLAHMAASAATLALPDSQLDMVRIGLSLYGLYPSRHLADRAELRPALSFHARVARVLSLEPGQGVGYGRTFVAAEPLTAALLPVGYADGLPRSHSNRGCVLVNGQRAPLIGRVSMDQCVVDVTGCGPVAEGDPAVVIGGQGQERISADEFAERSGTISYEVVTSLGHRVPRVYRSGGRVVGVAHLDEGRLEAWAS